VFIYPLMALPNTEMGRPDYQAQFGIKTRRIELAEIHGTVRAEGYLAEYEDLVVETSSMDIAEWRRMNIYSWIFMALHGLKLGIFILQDLLTKGIMPSTFIEAIMHSDGGFWRNEMAEYNKILDGVLERGEPIAALCPEYGEIYWGPEEATFFRATDSLGDFYDETGALLYDDEVIESQMWRIPTPWHYGNDKKKFAQQVVLYGRKSGQILLP
jgi:hypothetical protein